METGHITAHLRTMAAILVAAAIAGNCRLNAQDYDFAKTLDKVFGLGMSPNPGARPVMNGLYYQYMPGGQPLEFDESVYKDREHFDPNVYKFSKPQMQYDSYEGRHFKAGYTP